jgi:hypothetical protein
MIRNFTAISIIMSAFAVTSFFGVSMFSSSRIQAQRSQQESIGICCAWDNKLVNGILTYKTVGDSINTDSTKSERAVYNAINDWNSKLHGIKLVEVLSNTKDENDNSNHNRPDLQINLSSEIPRMWSDETISEDAFRTKPRLSTHGVSYSKRDSSSFIMNILITIFTSDPFGNTLLSASSFDPYKIEAIAKHEIGHARRVGHSDLISDLLYPVINRRTNTDISDCDVHAVTKIIAGNFESQTIMMMTFSILR